MEVEWADASQRVGVLIDLIRGWGGAPGVGGPSVWGVALMPVDWVYKDPVHRGTQ